MKISLINPQNLGKITGERDVDTLEELAKIITKYKWAPGIFKDQKRSIQTFIETSLLVLDIDDGCSLLDAIRIFKDFTCIVATTKSHQKEKNGKVCDRFRVLLFLTDSILNAEHYRQIYEGFIKDYPFVDPACKDASRYFDPCVDIQFTNGKGMFVTVPPYVEPVKPAPLPAGQPASGEKGRLTRNTHEFLLNGALPGYRHNAIVAAALDMKGQNYTEDEVMQHLEFLTEKTGIEHSDDHARKTVHDVFTRRVSKDEFREIPQSSFAASRETAPIYVSAKDLGKDMIDYLGNKDLISGDSTGFEGLDKLLGGGFRLGELTIMMAQAKTGKNTLYHDMMHRMLNKGIPQGYASRELDPATEVLPNLLSLEAGKNAWKENDLESLSRLAETSLPKWDLYFAPGYGYFALEEIHQWFKTLVDLGVKHFWLDHFQYMLPEEETKIVAKTIREIKTIAKTYKVHINLIVQPKHLLEGQRLSMDSLRGGSAINQALDNLLILERWKASSTDNVARLKLEVARHKLARPGQIFIQYDPESTRFQEVEAEKEEPTPPVTPSFNQAKLQLQSIKYAE